MAKMNDKKNVKLEVDTEETLPQNVQDNAQNTPTGIDPAVMMLMDQVKTLSQKLKKLEDGSKDGLIKSNAERYEGPRTYRYKLWGGVPVLSMKSDKKDPTKPIMYFTPKNEQVNNQLVELQLADGTTTKVDALEFGQYFEYSSSEYATEKIQPNGIKSYVFNHETYGEIEVLSSVIN